MYLPKTALVATIACAYVSQSMFHFDVSNRLGNSIPGCVPKSNTAPTSAIGGSSRSGEKIDQLKRWRSGSVLGELDRLGLALGPDPSWELGFALERHRLGLPVLQTHP
jgi:hypothetical protein